MPLSSLNSGGSHAQLCKMLFEAEAQRNDQELHDQLLNRLISDYNRLLSDQRSYARRLEDDLALARVIQREFLPKHIPDHPHLELACHYEPSGVVGGDLYDFIKYSDTELGVLVADISGHGVAGALLFAIFKALAHRYLGQRGTLAEQFTELNRELAAVYPDGKYASTFCALFNSNTLSLTYLKAAQEPGLWFHRDGGFTVLGEGGPLLGAIDPAVFGAPVYQTQTVQLEPGDSVVLYTDGIIEAADPHGKMYGFERFTGWLTANIAPPPPTCYNYCSRRYMISSRRTSCMTISPLL